MAIGLCAADSTTDAIVVSMPALPKSDFNAKIAKKNAKPVAVVLV